MMIRRASVVILLIAATLSDASFANAINKLSPPISGLHGYRNAADDREPSNKNPQTPPPSKDMPATPGELGAPGSQERDCAAACDDRCGSLGSPELTVQCRRNCAGRCLAPVEK